MLIESPEEKSNRVTETNEENFDPHFIIHFFTRHYAPEEIIQIIENLQNNYIELFLRIQDDLDIKEEVYEAYTFLKKMKEAVVKGLDEKSDSK